MELNRRIYEDKYEPEQLAPATSRTYDGFLIDLKVDLIRDHGGTRVVDIGCGPGFFIERVGHESKLLIGIDFSYKMVRAARERLRHCDPKSPLMQADAQHLPLRSNSVDSAYSFGTLYYVPDLTGAVREISRVLTPGGTAILEMGNRWSLNTLIAWISHVGGSAARPYHRSYRELRRVIRNAGLEIEHWRSFQVLPMYGASRKLFFLYPITASFWKKPLAWRWRGKMLDEWISSSFPLRYVAFRHIVVAKKYAK